MTSTTGFTTAFTKTNLYRLTLLLAGLLLARTATAFISDPLLQPLSPEVPLVYTDASGRAIRGYDPVAYFTAGEALQGSAEHYHRWRGAEWWFVSDAHRQAFIAEPERYAPQFGGYCAYCVGRGMVSRADPRSWVVLDGKLYLCKDALSWRWREAPRRLRALAERNWRTMLEQRKSYPAWL